MSAEKPTILCLASYEKGFDFLRQAKKEGCRVLLLTSKSLEHVEWPRESLDDIYFMPDVEKEWNLTDMIHGVSYLARSMTFDRIVALDDFDVEKGALLREHLRVPGMGDTQARFFRDKLAMRLKATESGLPVPRFTPTFPHSRVNAFLRIVPPPYLLKPRTQAGAIGIKKCGSAKEVWDNLNPLGDRQSYYLIEEFVTGDICHVDSIVHEGRVVFSLASQYARPPFEVYHQGRVFATRVLRRDDPVALGLRDLNERLLVSFGLENGVSHSEFIRGADGTLYFLETSARVGGANIADMIEAASGVNLWVEWAKLECAPTFADYVPPIPKEEYAGLLVSLAKQEWPDLSGYNDPEVYWRMHKRHHAGIVVQSPMFDRVEELVRQYTQRFYNDFFASLPAQEKATD